MPPKVILIDYASNKVVEFKDRKIFEKLFGNFFIEDARVTGFRCGDPNDFKFIQDFLSERGVITKGESNG